MSDRVSKMFWSASDQDLRSMKVFIEVYIDNQSVFVIIKKKKGFLLTTAFSFVPLSWEWKLSFYIKG
jgi:hypothetical protein